MGARELGNPLGNPLGLKRKSGGGQLIFPQVIYLQGAFAAQTIDTYEIPAGFSFCRITAIGGGGGASAATQGRGGGGGGLARSPVLSVKRGEKINYTIEPGGLQATDGGTTTASFRSLLLTATGGIAGTTFGGQGGIGSGGEVNSIGGLSGRGGGGCAGITSTGGAGATTSRSGSSYDGDGGGGGAVGSTMGGGGGGFGQPGGDGAASTPPYVARDTRLGPTRGSTDSALVGGNPNGGNFGGGGGGGNTLVSPGSGTGGLGGLIIELW